jgi:hypothetical protein
MYTSEDVLEMMDALPLGERLLVVEETLRKIRTSEFTEFKAVSPMATPMDKTVKPYKHPFFKLGRNLERCRSGRV